MAARWMTGVGLVVFMFVSGACTESSTTSPSSSNRFAGSWAGSTSEGTSSATQVAGTARLVLQQDGSTLSGTFTTTFGGQTTRDGATRGTADGSVATLSYTPPGAPQTCNGVALAQVVLMAVTVSGNRLSGTYNFFTCSGFYVGTLDLTKQ